MRLRVTGGPDKGLCFDLPETGVVSIGKARLHVEICLHDLSVSRVHCQVTIESGNLSVMDLDSDGGTRVNGELTGECALKNGDVVHIGQTELTVEGIEAAREAAPQPAPSTRPTRSDPELPPLALDDVPLPVLPAPASTAAPQAPQRSFRARDPEEQPLPVDDEPQLVDVHIDEKQQRAAKLDALSGTRLGLFEIGELIGRGHCGLVFRARHHENGRLVALKVLNPEFPKNRVEIERFMSVMKSVSALQHPNLVSVFAVGRTSPYTWIAEEHVVGEGLPTVIKRFGTEGVPDWRMAFDVAVESAMALDYTFGQHWLHRNITPANIIWRMEESVVKITDFGLSRALAGSFLRQAILNNKIAAEIGYLSPEQTHASPHVDIRTDLYNLGAVLYVLLMGRPPFSGKTQADTVAQIRQTAPMRPKLMQPTIADGFEQAVMRLLAKRPEDRFQAPTELMIQLADVAKDLD
jgi:hypothetical protein